MSRLYRAIRPALFALPPEGAHALAMRAARTVCRIPPLMDAVGRRAPPPDRRLATLAFGVRFANPVGLAAGLDKDADALPLWCALGFGHAEVGTVTALPQPGNPRPRVARLVADRAIVNAMGFPSVGAVAFAARLEAWRQSGAWPAAPVGINVGKSRSTELADAEDDYRATVRTVVRHADFLVVNVSSPNTPGLRELQDEARLRSLLTAVVAEADGTPVLVKLSPDLPDRVLAQVAGRVAGWGVRGIVVTNTTVSRAGLRVDPGVPGGLSGRPLASRARTALAVVRAATDLAIVSVGGIDGPAEAIRRLEAGADLIQVYTGLIYAGPSLAADIVRGIADELDRRGVDQVSQLRESRA